MLCNTICREGHVSMKVMSYTSYESYYILHMYDVKKETWEICLTQSKIQNKLVSSAITNELCHCCK